MERAWETAPLTFHVPTLVLRPGLAVQGQGVVSGRRPRREPSLHLICHRPNGRSADAASHGGKQGGGWGGGSRRRRSRKRNTDSESDKTGEESSARLIIVWLLGAICVRSGRKSESLFTDFTPQVCATRPVVRARENDGRCPIVCRLLDSERTLGANGSPPLPGVVGGGVDFMSEGHKNQ